MKLPSEMACASFSACEGATHNDTPSKKVPSTAVVSAVMSVAAARGAHPYPHRRHDWPTEMNSTHPPGVRVAARKRRKEGEGESLVERPHI